MWLFKAIATAEAATHRLNADLDIKEYLKPYAGRLLRSKLDPVHQVKELPFITADAIEMVKDSPYEIGEIVRLLKEGNIRVKLEHVGLEKTVLGRLINRIAFGILIAALLIASAIITTSNLSPLVAGVPVIGFIGFIVATILIVWLSAAVIRSGGM